MQLFAFWPRTATLPVAKYVKKQTEIEIAGANLAEIGIRDNFKALLDVLSQQYPDLVNDLEFLAATASDLGRANMRVEMLTAIQKQFIDDLPQAIKAQL